MQPFSVTKSTISDSQLMAHSLMKAIDAKLPLELILNLIQQKTINDTVKGITPLARAVYKRASKVVKLLLQKGALPTIPIERKKNNCFHIAAGQKDAKILKQLTTNLQPLQLEVKNKKGKTPLYIAASNANIAGFQLLKNLGALLGRKCGKAGLTALHIAAVKGHVEIIKLYKEHPHFVDQRNNEGSTAFMLACFNGNLEASKALLEVGANILACDAKDKTTGLHCAAYRNQPNIVELFSNNPEIIDAYDSEGRTAFHIACIFGHIEVAKKLVAIGARIDLVSKNTEGTGLHLAAYKGHVDIISLFSKRPELINALNKYGESPLRIASCYNSVIFILELLSNGASLQLLSYKHYNVNAYATLSTYQWKKLNDCCRTLKSASWTLKQETAIIDCLVDQSSLEQLHQQFANIEPALCQRLLDFLVTRQVTTLNEIRKTYKNVPGISRVTERHLRILLLFKAGNKNVTELFISSTQLVHAIAKVRAPRSSALQQLHRLNTHIFRKFTKKTVSEVLLFAKRLQNPEPLLPPITEEQFDEMSIYDLLSKRYGIEDEIIKPEPLLDIGLLTGRDLRVIGIDNSFYEQDKEKLKKGLHARLNALNAWLMQNPEKSERIAEICTELDAMIQKLEKTDDLEQLVLQFGNLTINPSFSYERELQTLDSDSAIMLIITFKLKQQNFLRENLLNSLTSSLSEYVQTEQGKYFSPYQI